MYKRQGSADHRICAGEYTAGADRELLRQPAGYDGDQLQDGGTEAEDAGRAFRGAAWHRRITE